MQRIQLFLAAFKRSGKRRIITGLPVFQLQYFYAGRHFVADMLSVKPAERFKLLFAVFGDIGIVDSAEPGVFGKYPDGFAGGSVNFKIGRALRIIRNLQGQQPVLLRCNSFIN